MINEETWKDVVGYEGLYRVSDWGRVMSLWFGKRKILKPGKEKTGYLSVQLCKDGKQTTSLIHRLVVTSFIGPIPSGMVVNHLNENKRDNRLSNLEICTHQKNLNYGTAIERRAIKRSNTLFLINAKTCGHFIFPSLPHASDFFGYARRTIKDKVHKAKKRGRNFISINKEKYYFSLI